MEGDKDVLRAPENVIIPLSLSRKLFGNESATGRQLMLNGGNITIGAVFNDFYTNTFIENCIYYAIPEDERKHDWVNWSYFVYFRVNEASNVSQLFENFKQDFDAQAIRGQDFDWETSSISLRFTTLSDLHYVTDVAYDQTPKASKQMLLILFAIAIVILTIAGINFTNFSTALTPMRIKSINTQRILGADIHVLRWSIVSEAIIISLLSYLLSISLVILFKITPLTKLVDVDLSIAAHPLIIWGGILVALFIGLLAGLFPAFYMTSFAPALVLNGSFGLTPKGKRLRNTLIGMQFVASFALIIGASFMYLQNHFMQHSPLGYDRDELITVDIGRIKKSRDAFSNQIKTYSGIDNVTYGESLLSSSDQYMGWSRLYKGELIHFQSLPAHCTFLKTMGIEITEGRDFREEDSNKQLGVFIFNETAQKKYNLEVGSWINGQGEIIGFMPDIKFASFRTTIEPMAFYVWGTENWGDRLNWAYIKVKAGTNMHTAMSDVCATLAEFDSEYPFEARFFDEVLQRLYEKETTLGLLISLFSIVAIFISIVGVFGLVVFDSESMRKEIVIRKIHGSSTSGIILLFNKAYFIILMICFIVATPLAWYAVHRWLEQFAYKSPMYWWVYLLAFITIGIITAATVTFQNWHVANENPVNSIKRVV